MRFCAALWVVVFHSVRLDTSRFDFAVKTGYLGVPLFFCLSGFVLAYSYDGRLYGDKVGVRFVKARFARVFPMLFVASLLTFGVDFFLKSHSFGTLLFLAFCTLTFVRAWIGLDGFDVPTWSLSAEAFFYAAFLPIDRMVERVSEDRLGFALFVCLVSCVALPATFPVAVFVFHLEPSTWLGQLADYSPLLRLPTFITGLFLYRVYRSGSGNFYRIATSRYTTLPLIVATLSLSAGLTALIAPNIDYRHLVAESIVSGVIAIPFSFLILNLAVSLNPCTKFLSTRPLVMLGEASYSLYLIHWPIWQLAISPYAPPWRFWEIWTIYIISVVALSVAAYRWIEVPCRRLIQVR